ncbi:hypothetical protein [Streptomyces sp. SID3343]|uniref:hypothetical protein n=1 Tax=Streptomyces sp. SID3343 TaxID=2690260 RepID=UPI001368FFFF|nr:hypothetical protein [Streptomyces sp. SID3343]MYW02584.1 hypothetical protein [Streptomyces sp. SID3343]
MGTQAAYDLDATIAHSIEVLTEATEGDRDWSRPAGELDWDCWYTLVHIVGDLYTYAGQVASGRLDDYVPVGIHAEGDPSPTRMLHAVRAGGTILSTVVATRPDSVRAYHPYGNSDPDGFAAMGMVEVMVHMYDLAAGLDLTYAPPSGPCARLMRLFPDAPTDVDPWSALLWSTGRVELPGHARRVGKWRWKAMPDA